MDRLILLVIVILGIVIGGIYSKINTVCSYYDNIISSTLSIQSHTKNNKELLLELQCEISKLNTDKNILIEIDKTVKIMNETNYFDYSKINTHIEQIDKLHSQIGDMIEIYNNHKEMKDNTIISKSIIEIDSFYGLMDLVMMDYNTVYVPTFNELISNFPMNLIAKSMGWYKLDMFKSIN